MRVSLKRGGDSIEAEGTLAEIKEVLGLWWNPAASSSNGVEEEPLKNPEGKQDAKGGKSQKRRVARKADTAGPKDDFDPRVIANAIKEDDRFETFLDKIILGSANRTQRSKFVIWHADKPMTSGQVQKVLQTLDVRIDPSTVSKGLSASRTDFITSEGTFGSEYKLTARARSDFEAWLFGG